MIIGTKGVPLNYVKVNEVAVFDENGPYKTAIIGAVTLQGPNFSIEARTVHRLMLHNVHEDSDAYTYIKSLLHNQNGRRDMLALPE